MVVQFMAAHRCVALLESLTGAAPSVGFVHGMLARAAGLLDRRTRAPVPRLGLTLWASGSPVAACAWVARAGRELVLV